MFFFSLFLCNKQHLLNHYLKQWHSDISMCGPNAQICLCIMLFKHYLQRASHLSMHVSMQIFSKLWHKLFKIKSLLYIESCPHFCSQEPEKIWPTHYRALPNIHYLLWMLFSIPFSVQIKWTKLCAISYDKTLYSLYKAIKEKNNEYHYFGSLKHTHARKRSLGECHKTGQEHVTVLF